MSITSQQEQRFWNHVDIKSTDDCWPWIAYATAGGYGIFRININSRCSAARFAYALSYGDFADNLQVLHKCHNTLCCNPNHLAVGTARENVLHDSVSDKLQSNSPTDYIGVRWLANRCAWEANGTLDGVARCLYYGSSKEAAVEARKSWEDSIRQNQISFLFSTT